MLRSIPPTIEAVILDSAIIDRIISTNEGIATFWSRAGGWAPEEALELLNSSRLDWQVELSRTLHMWTFEHSVQGQLILASANLGALVEGTLKLFLSVYCLDYLSDEVRVELRDQVVLPDSLNLERLRCFLQARGLLDRQWIDFILLVQRRRNAIHAFRGRDLGDQREFETCVALYLDLLTEIDQRLPYPF